MIHTHDLDGVRLDPIHDDKRKRRERELASAFHPALAAAIGERAQIATALVNSIGNSPSGLRKEDQEFRAAVGMIGAKEPDNAATQRTSYS